METTEFEQLKQDLGNVTDQDFLNALETNNETLLIETYEIPEINGAVKLFQFRETFIIHSVLPEIGERLALTTIRLNAVKCFTNEVYLLKTTLLSRN